MVLTIVLSSIACLGLILSVLFLPKVKIGNKEIPFYPLPPFIVAIVLILAGSISFPSVIHGLTSNTAINPLKILSLFISMTVLSVFLDEAGFFSYLAKVVLRKSGKSQIKLFFLFYAITSILTVFTSNDIIILTFTPFICYFSKNAKINPVPYLISEFVSANTWSMMLIIGNPTNIYLASSNGVAFFEYLSVMFLPTLFGGVTSLLILYLLFRKTLKTPLTASNEEVKLKNKPLTVIGLILLSSCTLLLAISSYVKIEMYLISVIHAVLLFVAVIIYKLIKKEKLTELKSTVIRAPWVLIPFVLSMFIIVLALKNQGVLKEIADFLGKNATIYKYGYLSFAFSNIINNIPMSVLFSSIIGTGIAPVSEALFSSIIGSNIGAFLTPIGALAGIMWINILSKQKIDFSFLSFIKYGAIIGIPTITATLLGLSIVL